MGLEPVIVTRAADRCMSSQSLRPIAAIFCVSRKGQQAGRRLPVPRWVYGPSGGLLDVPFAVGSSRPGPSCISSARGCKANRGFIFARSKSRRRRLAIISVPRFGAIARGSVTGGEVMLRGGWVRNISSCELEDALENEGDGYHVGFVHDSSPRASRSKAEYEPFLAGDAQEFGGRARPGQRPAELDYESTTHSHDVAGRETRPLPDYTAK